MLATGDTNQIQSGSSTVQHKQWHSGLTISEERCGNFRTSSMRLRLVQNYSVLCITKVVADVVGYVDFDVAVKPVGISEKNCSNLSVQTKVQLSKMKQGGVRAITFQKFLRW